MSRLSTALAMATVAAIASPAVAQARVAEIRANLIFDGGSNEAVRRIDNFQHVLEAMDGQVIWLELSLLNQEGDEPGNTYSISADTDVETVDQEGMEPVVCGFEGQIGLVDNFDFGYTVSFNRPADYHGPTTIRIGDRHNYPQQSIKCSAENYVSGNETALLIRGYFVVEFSEVPTAFTYDLIPIAFQE